MRRGEVHQSSAQHTSIGPIFRNFRIFEAYGLPIHCRHCLSHMMNRRSLSNLLLVVQHSLQPVQHPFRQPRQPVYHLEQLQVLLERYSQMQRNFLPNRYI